MTNVKPLQAYEIFNASCEAGSSKELMIKGLVESYDLRITSKTIPGGICAVVVLISIFDRYGYETLDRVLHLIVITWEGEQKSFSANMMNGVARLIYAYGAELKDNIFKEKLSEISIKEICKVAKERRAGSLGYAEAMLIFYSKRMKNAPHWKKMYENKKGKPAEVTSILTPENEDARDNSGGSSADGVIQAG